MRAAAAAATSAEPSARRRTGAEALDAGARPATSTPTSSAPRRGRGREDRLQRILGRRPDAGIVRVLDQRVGRGLPVRQLPDQPRRLAGRPPLELGRPRGAARLQQAQGLGLDDGRTARRQLAEQEVERGGGALAGGGGQGDDLVGEVYCGRRGWRERDRVTRLRVERERERESARCAPPLSRLFSGARAGVVRPSPSETKGGDASPFSSRSWCGDMCVRAH